MVNEVKDIRPVDQWGAFYLLRKCLRVRTRAGVWQVEAAQIIGKILLCLLSFVADVLTGLLYLFFLVLRHSVTIVFLVVKTVVSETLRRFIGVLSFGVSLILMVVILYLLITHWQQFTHFINQITHYFNVK